MVATMVYSVLTESADNRNKVLDTVAALMQEMSKRGAVPGCSRVPVCTGISWRKVWQI